MKILWCGIFPARQRTLELKALKIGAVNRIRSVACSVGGQATNAARALKAPGKPLLAALETRPALVKINAAELQKSLS